MINRTKPLICLYSLLPCLMYCVSGSILPYAVELSDMFKNYSSVYKPRKDLSRSVLVNITFHLNVLGEINERLQTMRFIAWFEISWVDEFLILSEDVESLLIPKQDIWYPDISIYDTVEDPQTISDGQHVILFQDGRVSWYPGNEYVTRCSIDIRRYPFDDQVCNLRVGAWHTTAWTQQLTDSGKGLDISNYVENGEWEITRTMVEANKSPGYNTSWIRYHIYLKRRSLHPILNTLAPVVMLSFLNTLVFLLPANSGEKVTLCISVLLSFTVFLTVFNDTMPKMSTTISYLSIYLVVQLGMSVFGIVMSIYIWRMKDREDNKYHFVNVSANKNEEEINRSVYTKSEDLKDHSISLRLQGYKDGIEENIAIGESSKTEGCQGDESDFHFFNSNYSNGFLRKESSRKTRYSTAVFPSSQKYNIDEKDADDPNRKIKKLDMIMFVITFCLVMGSTIFLFVALLI